MNWVMSLGSPPKSKPVINPAAARASDVLLPVTASYIPFAVPAIGVISLPLVTHAERESLNMFAAMKSGDLVIISLRNRAGIPKRFVTGPTASFKLTNDEYRDLSPTNIVTGSPFTRKVMKGC